MIGWNQLIYSHIAIQWIQWLTTHSPNTNHSSMPKVIQLTWEFILATWKLHNQHLHDPSNAYETNQLQATVG